MGYHTKDGCFYFFTGASGRRLNDLQQVVVVGGKTREEWDQRRGLWKEAPRSPNICVESFVRELGSSIVLFRIIKR